MNSNLFVVSLLLLLLRFPQLFVQAKHTPPPPPSPLMPTDFFFSFMCQRKRGLFGFFSPLKKQRDERTPSFISPSSSCPLERTKIEADFFSHAHSRALSQIFSEWMANLRFFFFIIFLKYQVRHDHFWCTILNGHSSSHLGTWIRTEFLSPPPFFFLLLSSSSFPKRAERLLASLSLANGAPAPVWQKGGKRRMCGFLTSLVFWFFSGKIMRFAEMSKIGQNSEVCVASEMSRFFFF